jgi:uncharacterized protein YbjT (DUF2867 family)
MELIEAGPAGRVADLGGPEIVPMRELARRYLSATGRHRLVTSIPVPGEIGRAFREGQDLAPEHVDGRVTFTEFLAARAGNR